MRNQEHVTNIARMEALLELHPEVGEVTKYKIQKALDISVFTKDGRCRGHSGDGHQSPHDLRVSLAATGAVMELGCTVNNVKAHSIALWWKPHAPFSEADQDKMCAIFRDVMEQVHVTPAECATFYRAAPAAAAAAAAAKANQPAASSASA